MSFRLDTSAPASETIRTTAADQLHGAVAVLDRGFTPEAIHDARKRVKRTRAVLRLARPAIAGRRYRTINDQLRDSGRALSAARDDDVLAEVAADLVKHATGQVPAAELDALRAHFSPASRDVGSAIANGASGLAEAERTVERWPIDRLRWKHIEDALELSHRRGRAAMRAVVADPTDERRHDWRKRAKDLWYQGQLLRDAHPGLLEAEAKVAHELADKLGDDHDLAVLDERVATETIDGVVSVQALREVIRERREELLAEALALGARVYAEKPAAFRQRIGRYIRSARAESRGAPAPA